MLRIRKKGIVMPSLIQRREDQLGLSLTPFHLPDSHIIHISELDKTGSGNKGYT
jgi:hypothetical protein